jgi:hypothetical protein
VADVVGVGHGRIAHDIRLLEHLPEGTDQKL